MTNLFSLLSSSIGKPEVCELLQQLNESLGAAEITESKQQWRLLDFPNAGTSVFCFDGVVVSVLLQCSECLQKSGIRDQVLTKFGRKQFNAPLPGGIICGDKRSVVQNKLGRQPISRGLASDLNDQLIDYYDFDSCDLRFTFDGVTRQLDCVELLVKRDWRQYVETTDCPHVTDENFSGDALAAMRYAHSEAQKLGHNFIGSEHLLLGILSEQTSIAAKALQLHHVTLEAARAEVTRITGQKKTLLKFAPPLTPRSRLLLSVSMKLALSFGSKKISPEHILLAIIEHHDGVASTVLEILGIDFTEIRRTISKLSN